MVTAIQQRRASVADVALASCSHAAFDRLRRGVLEEVAEALSPTRCLGCERSGSLICERCLQALQLIDPVQSCLRCAAPFGDLLCTECERDNLQAQRSGAVLAPTPIDRCLAMAVFADPLPRIIRSYKDAGERRAAPLLAELLFDTLDNAERAAPERYGGIVMAADALVFIPATARAYRRRGFDHMQAIATPLAVMTDIELVDALVKHGSSDQRALGRQERQETSLGAYEVVADIANKRVLLIDDVITTGATVRAAASALKRAGARSVDVAALARVW